MIRVTSPDSGRQTDAYDPAADVISETRTVDDITDTTLAGNITHLPVAPIKSMIHSKTVTMKDQSYSGDAAKATKDVISTKGRDLRHFDNE